MKIPGLTEALERLEQMDDMIPTLKEIASNLAELVRIQKEILERTFESR